MGFSFSTWILVLLPIGLSSQYLNGPSSFLYFTCLRGRSVKIKLDALSDESYRFEDLGTDPDILACFTKCGSRTGLILFSKSSKSRSCVCVFPESQQNQLILEQEFRVAPSDLSGACTVKKDTTACHIGEDDAYSLYCNEERTLIDDGTFCDEISDTGNFRDPAWMSGNFDAWQEHMNDFPKCVQRDHIQVWEPSFILEDFEMADPVITCREKSGNAKYFMIGFAQDGQTRTCIPAETYESFTFPDTVGTGIVLATDCQPCYPGDFKTCGSPQSFSIYCNSDECKSLQIVDAYYYYFGCTAKVPTWANSEGFFLGEKSTLHECISNCSKSVVQDYNIFIAAQHVNDDATESEASVECRCFNFRNDAPHLGLHSRTSIEGCERGWSPPVGGPAGNFKDRILQYGVYCHSAICSSILPSYVQKPITHCCSPDDCVPSTSSPTDPTTFTPTDKTTTTTPTTTAITTTPTSTTETSTTTSTTTITTTTTTTSTTTITTTTTTTSTTTNTTTSTTTTTTTSTTTSTTTKTTTTTTTATTGATITTSPPCYFCPGRFDQRGYFWNATCAGHFIVASDSCPEGTSGNAFWYCDLETLDFMPLQPNRVGCTPTWIENVVDQAHTPNSDPKEITTLILENICHFDTSLEQITSGTLIKIIEVGFLLPTRMTDPGNEMNYHRNVTNTFDIVLDYVQIVSDLLHHEVAWLEYDDDLILQKSTNLLKSAENIAFFLLQIDGAKVGFDRLITDSRDEVRMYTQSTFSRNESLSTMPRPPFIQLDGPSLILGDWRSVGIQFRTQGIFEQIFHPSRNDLGLTSVELHSVAKISTFSINEWRPLASDGKVKVSFDHIDETEVRGRRYCVFWDEEKFEWSQKGCELSVESSLLNTVCICNHTTNFAVLFDVDGVLDDLSDVALAFLNILSTILCTVSAIGTLLTFAILLFSKLPSSPRTIIQMNRAFSLFCLYLLFLLGIDPTILGLPDWMCRGVAVFIHFFGLSSFFWTSLEGIQLYRALVNKRLSDDDGRYFKLLRFVIGYGISLVIVFLTLVIQFVLDADNAYDHENDEPEDAITLCWLREKSFIWAFVGPALAVILLNFIIMLRTVKVVYRVQKRINRRGLAEVKGHLKSWAILTFLLGITWASGLLINKVTVKYGAYIFVALNGSLGIFTFIHSILLNQSVLGELKIRLGILDKNDFDLNLGGDRANALKQYTRKNRRQGIKSELRHHRRPEYVTDNSLEMSSPDECSLPASSIGSSHRSPRQIPRLLNAPGPNRPGFLFGRRKSSIAQLSQRDRRQISSSQQLSSQRVVLAQDIGRAIAVPAPSRRINGSI